MNFFKRLFSSKKDKPKKDKKEASVNPKDPIPEPPQNKEPSGERYVEEQIDASILEGSFKLIESYFHDNKLERKIKEPINHPLNLDQVIDEGFGFQMYCKAFKMEDNMIIASLSMAFSDFMVKEFGFKHLKDKQPEYPLRFLTLKYAEKEAVLSLYPFEYAAKVLNYEASFEEIYGKVKVHLENLPNIDDLIDGNL